MSSDIYIYIHTHIDIDPLLLAHLKDLSPSLGVSRLKLSIRHIGGIDHHAN